MKSKFNYITVISLLLALCFSGCQKEDDIISELGEDDLKLEDSSDPLDHYIYEFYKKYNSYILYEYETPTYQWDFETLKQINFAKQEDKNVLLNGIEYFEKTFIRFYSEEFRKKFIPTKILLADSINETRYRGKLDIYSESATAYLAIGRMRKGIENTSNEELNKAKIAVNYDFWLGYLLVNDKLRIPSEYYEPSKGLYHVNLKALSENVDNASIDPKKYGFWADMKGRQHTGSKYFWTPDVNQDLEQMFMMILSHTKAEMMEMMEDSPKLKVKYTILVNSIQEQLQFDIQSIGDSN